MVEGLPNPTCLPVSADVPEDGGHKDEDEHSSGHRNVADREQANLVTQSGGGVTDIIQDVVEDVIVTEHRRGLRRAPVGGEGQDHVRAISHKTLAAGVQGVGQQVSLVGEGHGTIDEVSGCTVEHKVVDDASEQGGVNWEAQSREGCHEEAHDDHENVPTVSKAKLEGHTEGR